MFFTLYINPIKPTLLKIGVLLGILLAGIQCYAQPSPVVITDRIASVEIKGQASFLIDSSRQITEHSILNQAGEWQHKNNLPVMQVNPGYTWVKFSVYNQTSQPTVFLDLQYSNITGIVLYKSDSNHLVKIAEGGNGIKYNTLSGTGPNYIFPLDVGVNHLSTYFLKINSYHPLLLPAFIKKQSVIDRTENMRTIITGIYIGIIFAMFFYNLFLFISTLDRSYLAYVLFLMFLGLAQLTVSGNTFKYLWPGCPDFNRYALIVTSALAGITGISFGIYFLHIKRYMPRLYLLLLLVITSYVASILFSIFNYNYTSYQMLNINGVVGSISLLVASYLIGRNGYKPAYFYFVAWVSFLVGLVVFSLRNFNVLPNNYFTTYILYVGSAIEAILLSIALADKINILRKEKEVSQEQALRISQENERLVREQNILLERKVMERTEELQLANGQLSEAFSSLKDAQIQLVEAEKMASLGQLTAGIAHEINNPINFVKSNIKPLVLDINDLFMVIDEYGKLHKSPTTVLPAELGKIEQLRSEIDMDFVRSEVYSLMQGIEDGADRTAEIVRGLRNFSRLDESQVKVVNVHEGLDSTLIILRNIVPENIKVIKQFEADGEIECYPGKLNQVFMNILNNSIQAIKSKPINNEPEQITIITRDISDDKIEIIIRDTGPGMTPEVRQKIFDPFFTTKDVGEGTGLGLAIVFRIVQEHQGKIEVISNAGEGAEFVITLHRTIPMKMPI